MEGKVNYNGNCFKGEEHVVTIISLKAHNSGESAKLRRATFIFVTSVRSSVRMEHFGSHWTEFY